MVEALRRWVVEGGGGAEVDPAGEGQERMPEAEGKEQGKGKGPRMRAALDVVLAMWWAWVTFPVRVVGLVWAAVWMAVGFVLALPRWLLVRLNRPAEDAKEAQAIEAGCYPPRKPGAIGGVAARKAKRDVDAPRFTDPHKHPVAVNVALLRLKMAELARLFRAGDVRSLCLSLRSGLERDFAGIASHTHAHDVRVRDVRQWLGVAPGEPVETLENHVQRCRRCRRARAAWNDGAGLAACATGRAVALVHSSPLPEEAHHFIALVTFLLIKVAWLPPLGRPALTGGSPSEPGQLLGPGLGPQTVTGGMKGPLPSLMLPPSVSSVLPASNAPPTDGSRWLLNQNEKIAFFNESRHAYGRTALMLSGGGLLGLFHLGVVRTLFRLQMLPKVICGSSAGSIIASFVGLWTDQELTRFFDCLDARAPLTNPVTGIPLDFDFFDDISLLQKLQRLCSRSESIHSIEHLQKSLRANLGDVTFAEAYQRTGRIINISLTPVDDHHPAVLLNYLKTPSVLVWSACAASSSLPGVFNPASLYQKNAAGDILSFMEDNLWIDGSIKADIPLARIGELFAANHYIVSQTNPHFVARSWYVLNNPIVRMIKSEIQFRYWQLAQLGLVSRTFSVIFGHVVQPYTGDVTISHGIGLADLVSMFINPTPAILSDLERRGAAATADALPHIRAHTSIETALEVAIAVCVRGGPPAAPPPPSPTNSSRASDPTIGPVAAAMQAAAEAAAEARAAAGVPRPKTPSPNAGNTPQGCHNPHVDAPTSGFTSDGDSTQAPGVSPGAGSTSPCSPHALAAEQAPAAAARVVGPERPSEDAAALARRVSKVPSWLWLDRHQ